MELKNTGDQEINMNGISFVDGIDYTFGDTTIIPGAYIVLASNSAEFNRLYNFMPLGEYDGQLDNGGEIIVLVNAAGDTIFSFSYDDSSPWPEEADGEGYSIVSKDINGNGDPNLAEYWIRSGAINGSPGATDIATGIEIVNSSAPNKYSLVQNYPNPFNPSTNITYTLPERAAVKIIVYDMLGREIKTLINEIKDPGTHSVEFTASGNDYLPSGVYFYSITANKFRQTNKMLLIK
ncbi:MAG: lamin tail domain-containing protein [Ignavibacteriaceae bacterium]